MKIALLASVFALSSLQAIDWPHFLGPQRNSSSKETGLLKSFTGDGPEVLWEVALEDGFGGAAVVGDELFLLDRVHREKDMLRCHDAKTGKEKWRFESSTQGEPSFPGSRNVPTVEKDAVYYTTPYGNVFRINRKTRKPDWNFKLSERYPDAQTPHWGYAQTALIIGDVLIVTPFGEKTGIAGLDKKTGKELWQSPGIGNTHSSPTYLTLGGVPQVAILTTGGTVLTSYDPKTGAILWSTDLYKNRIPITVPVQIDEERLFVSGGYNAGSKMLRIKKSNSGFKIKELWQTKKGSQVHPALLIDDHLYFLANENSNHKAKAKRKKGGLVCMSLKGEEKWSTGNDPFMGRGASLYADGMLIIQDGEKGTLRLVDPNPQRYHEIASANVFKTDERSRKDLKYWSNLALADGKLFMRGQNRLLCVKMK